MFLSIRLFLHKHRYLIALLLVLFFHLVGNVVWIALNQSPPSWDEANHIRRSVQYTYFIQDLLAGRPDWGTAWDSFQDGYGPLVRIITGIFMLFAGVGVVQTQIVSTLFFLATIVAVYLLAREIANSETENWRRHLLCAFDGVLPRGTSQAKHGVETQQHFPSTIIAISTALVFSFYQLIYAHSRWLILDIPVTLFTTLSYLFLIKSGWGCKRKETILAGVLAACAMLTKAQAIVYFVIPALYLAYVYLSRTVNFFACGTRTDEDSAQTVLAAEIAYPTQKGLLNLLISLFVCLGFFSLWALPNLTHMYEYVKAGATIRLNHPDDLRSMTTWTFYLKLIINNITTLWGLLLWLPACFVFLRKHKKQMLFIISLVFGYYLWFSLISNKDLRFIYPIFPLFAYIGAFGWARILIYLRDTRKAVWMGVAIATLSVFFMFQITMYTVLSFGWPFPKNITSYVLVPGIDDITMLNTASDYPVKAYGADKWPVQELAQDIKDYFADKPFTYVFLVPNFEYFNNNTITLELTRIRAQNVVLMGGINKQSFENPRELDDFVKQYAHFIYVEGEFGPYFQWDRAFYAQVQQYVEDIYSLGRSKTHKSYQLPNGQIVHWFIIDP